MNTLFVGQHILRLDKIDSTNEHAFALLREVGLPEGSVITAENQFSGKGQRGNTWNSEPGKNLTASFVFKPQFLDAEDYFYLTKITTIAIFNVIKDKVELPVKIKWPNDIYIDNRKVGGILIENQLKGSRIGTTVIGIGLNVNQIDFGQLSNKATSLKIESDTHYSIDYLLTEVCEHIEANYLRVKANKHDLDRLFEKQLFGLNQWKTFEVDGVPKELMIKGVSPHGRLEVIDRNETPQKYDFRQIKFMI